MNDAYVPISAIQPRGIVTGTNFAMHGGMTSTRRQARDMLVKAENEQLRKCV